MVTSAILVGQPRLTPHASAKHNNLWWSSGLRYYGFKARRSVWRFDEKWHHDKQRWKAGALRATDQTRLAIHEYMRLAKRRPGRFCRNFGTVNSAQRSVRFAFL